MSTLKAVYINELFKISKKKKIIVASIFSILAVLVAAIIVYSLNSFVGIRVTGSSDFSLLVLTVLIYTLIPLFTAFVCIDMFGGEFSEQTIKLTLTSPASRLTVFTGKILAAGSFVMANLLFVMIFSVLASFFINGTSFGILKVLLSYIAAFFPLFVFSMAVVVISLLTRGTTSAFMLTVLLYLVLFALTLIFPILKSFIFISAFDWYRLFLGSYINFSKIIRVFLILCGYGMMLFGIGYCLFDKKNI